MDQLKYFWVFVAITTTTTIQIEEALAQQSAVQLLTGLKFGDFCNHVVEEFRQTHVRNISTTSLSRVDKIIKTTAFASIIEDIQQPLCNANALLVCDKASSSCICGEVGEYALFGEGAVQSSARFELENDGKGNVKCVYSRGSGCVESTKLPQVYKGPSACRGGTRCSAKRVRATPGTCPETEVIWYAMVQDEFSQRSLLEDLYRGLICTCE